VDKEKWDRTISVAEYARDKIVLPIHREQGKLGDRKS
jgi:hypothetical protein